MGDIRRKKVGHCCEDFFLFFFKGGAHVSISSMTPFTAGCDPGSELSFIICNACLREKC